MRHRFGLRQTATLPMMVLLGVVSAAAQMAPTRTWEELKQETQRRLDKNLGPMGGLKSDEFYAYGARLSLKTQGLLGQPSAPMLVLNVEKDSQVPISDLYLLMQSGGTAKWSWVNPDGGHTGRSQEWPNSRIAEEIVAPWIKARLEPESRKSKLSAGN